MKINEDLKKAAGTNPTLNSRTDYISKLCEEIKKGKITLPLYQRDLSWSIKKSIDLFNYQLLSKSPISAISFNMIQDSVDSCVPQVSFVTRERISVTSGTNSVVDGQQRLATNYKAYTNDPDFEKICLDLIVGKFVEIRGKRKKHQIPVGVLFNESDEPLKKFISDNKIEFDIGTDLMAIRSKFKTYSYTVNFATDLSEDEQIDWFEVLNNAGSRVTDVQLKLSKMRIHDLDIYSEYVKSYVKIIKDAGFDFFKPTSTNVSYPISALNPAYEVSKGLEHTNNYAPFASDAKANKIKALKKTELDEIFKMTIAALKQALEFIRLNKVTPPTRIDYINYLLGYFVFNPGNPSAVQTRKIMEWYEEANFSASNQKRRELFTKLLKI